MSDPHQMMPQPDRPINKPTLPNQRDDEGPVLHGRPVSMPDVVFQIVLPIAQDNLSTLTDIVRSTFPQAEVVLAQGQVPFKDNPAAACSWIGVWTQGSIASEADLQNLLLGFNFLKPTPGSTMAPQLSFAMFLNSAFIQSQATSAFASMPKQLNPTTGAPDPHGSLHLTGLSVLFPPQASSTITTQVTGFSTQTFPSIDFTATITDKLGTTMPPGGTLTVSSASSVSYSFASLDTATIISLIGGVLIDFPLFIVVPLAFATEDVAARSLAPSSVSAAGAGSQLVGQFLPKLTFPTLDSLVFTYTDVIVGPLDADLTGVVARGQFVYNSRNPRIASIAGPDTLFIDENLTASYHAILEDFFPTVRCTWNTDGQITSQTSATAEVEISFPDPGTTGRSRPPYTSIVQVGAAEPGNPPIPNPPATAQKTVSLVYRHTPPSGHQGQDSGEDLSHSSHHG